jgi:hypothetical protein
MAVLTENGLPEFFFAPAKGLAGCNTKKAEIQKTAL